MFDPVACAAMTAGAPVVNEQQRLLSLELEQARYEARLAERRYAACDPDNRLIAAQLEKTWEVALRRVEDLQTCQLSQEQEEVELDAGALAPSPILRRISRRLGTHRASPCVRDSSSCVV
jgi:hypothetical protein